jgi:calcium-dependent protein kinase
MNKRREKDTHTPTERERGGRRKEGKRRTTEEEELKLKEGIGLCTQANCRKALDMAVNLFFHKLWGKDANGVGEDSSDTSHGGKPSYSRNAALDEDENIVCHGYLKKMGLVFKTWRKRYLVLYTNDELVYYQSGDMATKQGVIHLDGTCRLNTKMLYGKYYFFLWTPARRFYMRCRSLEDRDRWVEVLKNCITVLGEKKRSVMGNAFIKSIDDYFNPDAASWQDAELGSGNFGTVWRARGKTGTEQLCAIKSVSVVSNIGRDSLKNEIELLKAFNHPNIVQLHSVHETSSSVYIVQELCTGGELFDAIINFGGKFNEYDVASIMKDAFSAIEYCHDRNVCHRDLKPENFLLAYPINTDRNSNDPFPPVKIVDFGVSASISLGQQATGIAGTIFYMAPEVFNEAYGVECDMWSLGVILYILLSGHLPFGGNNVTETVEKIQSGLYGFCPSEWDSVSEDAIFLMKGLLQVDTSMRLTAGEALANEWILKNSRTVYTKEEPRSKSEKQPRGSVISRLAMLGNTQKYRKRFLQIIADEVSSKMILSVRKNASKVDSQNSMMISMDDFVNRALVVVVQERRVAALQPSGGEADADVVKVASENDAGSRKSLKPSESEEKLDPLTVLIKEFNHDASSGASAVFNYEEFIEECLNTKELRAQKLLEAVFAEEGSSDSLSAVLKRKGRGSFLSREIQQIFTIEESDAFDVGAGFVEDRSMGSFGGLDYVGEARQENSGE